MEAPKAKYAYLCMIFFVLVLCVTLYVPQHKFNAVHVAFKNADRNKTRIVKYIPTGIIPKTPVKVTNKKPYLHGGIPLHDLGYVIENSALCSNNAKLYYFVYVYSAPYEFDQRQQIRETWGRANILKDVKGKMGFFLARSNDAGVMKKIAAEQKTNGDIVLANFLDSYTNLTHKSVMALKWLNVHCKSAKFYVKVDTDVLLDVFILKRSLDKYLGNVKRTFLCYVWKGMIVLRQPSKWQVPKDQFSPAFYPIYCSGPMWVFTADILNQLYLATYRVPFINVEDAYTSGLLPQAVGHVHHLGSSGLVEPVPHGARLDRYTAKNRGLPLGSVPDHKIYRQAWNAIVDRLTDKDKEQLTDDYKKMLKSTKKPSKH